MYRNGVTDLATVWARTPDLSYDSAGTGDSTNPAVGDVEAEADRGTRPYDWSRPVVEPGPFAALEGDAANERPSASDDPAQDGSPAEPDVTERRLTGIPDLGADAPLAAPSTSAS